MNDQAMDAAQGTRFTPEVHCVTLPRFHSNTYVVVHPRAAQAVVVDPGDADVGPVELIVNRLGVLVPYIILTHEHFDHVAGANRMRERLGSKLVCSASAAKRAMSPQGNMSRYWGEGDIVAGPPDVTCEQAAWTLDWSGVIIRMLSTPGHTPGSICISIGNCLFSGDTLLDNARTPTNLPDGSAHALEQSVDSLVRAFPADTLVWPGHGESFSLSSLRIDKVLGRNQHVASELDHH
jgi:glyoxylase-like metal-dependent hydrolase (beta-lactamase superfamily II)